MTTASTPSAGVSPPRDMNVESKEALFYLLVVRGADPPSKWKPKTWPVRTPTRDRLMKRLREQITAAFALPQLDAALERQRVPNIRVELERIVRELYERTEHTREPATVIARSAADLPDLFQLFFVRVRRDLFARFTRYVQRRMEDGYFSGGLDPAAAGRFRAGNRHDVRETSSRRSRSTVTG